MIQKAKSKILFLSVCLLTIAQTQACEQKKKRFDKGGFFTGVSTAYGIPVFILGQAIYSSGKDTLNHCFFSCERSKAAHLDMFTGRSLRFCGAGLVIVPMLVNNRQLLRDYAKR